ncbi:hypothetical protein EJ05DRAFT_477890 [Pseudovirgaria hyperparasitica]|uniref:SAC3/GANP/THP3 conserved domain-containing protein n=1 Tax=Pseudovirgaria hyperparasitica TaxID=470096 RepID=A0A6A6W1L6_9PEZI|nr:uncharacterized protein EJ05DRAFT_477890 [Pseudovirgaria hyperparasitica]KAF2755820.1 hypothetical protein EJ05DRAFT_477890 [Pseudovirgaria hyperparasitica]
MFEGRSGRGSTITKGGPGLLKGPHTKFQGATDDTARLKSRHGMNNVSRGGARGNARSTASTRGRGRGGRAQPSGYPSQRRKSQDSHISQEGESQTSVTYKPTGDAAHDRWKLLQQRRQIETKNAIDKGLIWDQSKKGMRLGDARAPRGTCPSMCPEYERAERISNNDVWAQERDAQNKPDETRMVKKFRRAAAGQGEALPSDLRPPEMLQKTMDFLVNDVIANAEWLGDVAKFVWDRTRMIRTDFTIQRVAEVKKDYSNMADVRIAMETYERCIRYHILSMHHNGDTARETKPDYSWQQDLEQLESTFSTLTHMYDDHRDHYRSPNEVEMKSYQIILAVRKATQSLEHDIETKWPPEFITNPAIDVALKIYAAAGDIKKTHGPLRPETTFPVVQANWQHFWNTVRSSQVSYLMACAAEAVFDIVRHNALNAIWNGYNRGKGKPTDFEIKDLKDILAFDTPEETLTYCEYFGFTAYVDAMGRLCLDLGEVRTTRDPLRKPKDGLKPQYMAKWIEPKRKRRNLAAIINGWSVEEAEKHGMLVEQIEENVHVEDVPMKVSKKFRNESSLFVPENPESPENSEVDAEGDEEAEDDEDDDGDQENEDESEYEDEDEDGDKDEEEEEHEGNQDVATATAAVAHPGRRPEDNPSPKLNPFASAFQPRNSLGTTTKAFGGTFGQPSVSYTQPPAKTATSSPFSAFASASNPSSSSTFGKPSFQPPIAVQKPTSLSATTSTPEDGASSTLAAQSLLTQSAFSQPPSSHDSKPSSVASPFAPPNPSPSGTTSPLSTSAKSVTHPESAYNLASASEGRSNDLAAKSSTSSTATAPATNPFGFGGTFPSFTTTRPSQIPAQASSSLQSFTKNTQAQPLPPQVSSSSSTSTATLSAFAPTSAPASTAFTPSSVTKVTGPAASTLNSSPLAKPTQTQNDGDPSITGEQQISSSFSKSTVSSQFPESTISDQQNRTQKRSEIFESLAVQLIEEPERGFMKQLMDFVIFQTVRESLGEFEEEKLRKEADAFRQNKLAIKYCIIWYRNVKRKKSRQRRHDRKERARQQLELMKAKENEIPKNSAEALLQARSRNGKEKLRSNGVAPTVSRTVEQPDTPQEDFAVKQPVKSPVESPVTHTPVRHSPRPFNAAELFGVTPRNSISRHTLDTQSVRPVSHERLNQTHSAYFNSIASSDVDSTARSSFNRKRTRHVQDDGSDDDLSPDRNSLPGITSTSYWSKSRKRMNSLSGGMDLRRSFGPIAGLNAHLRPSSSHTSHASTPAPDVAAVDPRDAALLARVARARASLMGTSPSVSSSPALADLKPLQRTLPGRVEGFHKEEPRDKPAYWYRISRFVKREDYGKAVLDVDRPKFSLTNALKPQLEAAQKEVRSMEEDKLQNHTQKGKRKHDEKTKQEENKKRKATRKNMTAPPLPPPGPPKLANSAAGGSWDDAIEL